MIDKIKEVIGVANDGAQSSITLYKSFTDAGSSIAVTLKDSITSIKNALLGVVDFFSKVAALFPQE